MMLGCFFTTNNYINMTVSSVEFKLKIDTTYDYVVK